MIVRLRETEVGDRFVAADTGIAWTVMSNDGGYVKLVSAHQQPFEGWPPENMTVDVMNRDPNLTDAAAFQNLANGGVAGRVIAVE